MKVWYVRGRQGHERTRYRHTFVEKAFPDFQLLYPRGLEGIARNNWTCDVMFIAGRGAARAVHRMDVKKRAGFRVYIPSWRRGGCEEEVRAIVLTAPHLVCPDQTMYLDEFRKVHGKVHFVDRGFDPNVFYPSDGEKDLDVVFCGNFGYGRRDRLLLLSKALHGRVYVRQGLSHQLMAGFLRRGRIGWNQIMRPKNGIGINYRVWEVLGCGILLLSNRTSDVEKVLVGRKHCVLWDNDKDMIEKARYYLDHDEEREKIARAGHQEALSKHTWTHRAQRYKELVGRYI